MSYTTPIQGMGKVPLTGRILPAGTAAALTTTLINPGYRAIAVVLNTTVCSAGNTVTVQLNGVTATGMVYPILTSAVIAAVGVTRLIISPEIPLAANLTAQALVPATLQIVTTIAGVVAYGIDYDFAV